MLAVSALDEADLHWYWHFHCNSWIAEQKLFETKMMVVAQWLGAITMVMMMAHDYFDVMMKLIEQVECYISVKANVSIDCHHCIEDFDRLLRKVEYLRTYRKSRIEIFLTARSG
jgi:imidazoleglycerol phosphate dehydratase HisB